MFKAEVEVKGEHIKGEIRLDEVTADRYCFYPTEILFSSTTELDIGELTSIAEELYDISNKLNELNNWA